MVTFSALSCKSSQPINSETVKEDSAVKSTTFTQNECISFLNEKDKIDELLVCAKEFKKENPVLSHLYRGYSFTHNEKYDSANFHFGKILNERSLPYDERLPFIASALTQQAINLYELGECDTSITYFNKVWEDYIIFDFVCSEFSLYYAMILIKCNKNFKARRILNYSISNFRDENDSRTYGDYFYLLAMTYPKSDSLSYRCQYLDSAVSYFDGRRANKEKFCD
jgi:tetratricopeptide (TPR) repeat protein